MKYFNDENIKNFEFDQIPRNVGNLIIEGKLEQIDIRVYMKMFRMTKITLFKNENGDRFIKFAYKSIMKEFDIKSKTTVSNSIKRLKELGLIHIESVLGYASKYFLVCGTETCNTVSQETVQVGGVNEVDSNIYSKNIKIYNNNIYKIFYTISKKFGVKLCKDDIEKTVYLFKEQEVWKAINNLKIIQCIDDIKNFCKKAIGKEPVKKVIQTVEKTIQTITPSIFLSENNAQKYEDLSFEMKRIYDKTFNTKLKPSVL